MIITPISGKPVRREYYDIGFEINHRQFCQEAFHKRLEIIQGGYPDFDKLSEEVRMKINAAALIGTVVTMHDDFTDSEGLQFKWQGELSEEDKQHEDAKYYANQSEMIMVRDSMLRSWVYTTYNNVTHFEDKKKAEVVKKF